MQLTLDHVNAVLDSLIDLHDNLSPHARVLYEYLVLAAGDDGICRLSERELAAGAGISKGSVSNGKQALKAAGLIVIGDRKDGIRDAHKIYVRSIWEGVRLVVNDDGTGDRDTGHDTTTSGHETDGGEYSAQIMIDEDDPELRAKLEELHASIFNNPDLTAEEKKSQWQHAAFVARLRHGLSGYWDR